MCRIICLLLLMPVLVFSQDTRLPFDAPHNAVMMEWRGVPLKVDIPVRKDRVIRFTQSKRLQVGIPTDLQGIASAETIQGVVHIRSYKAFPETSFWFRDKDTGAVYRLDITATGDSERPPIIILDPELPVAQNVLTTLDETAPAAAQPEQLQQLQNGVTDNLGATVEPAASFDFIEEEPAAHGVTALTRFAFQNIYSPERLVGELENVHKTPIRDLSYTHMVVGSKVSARTIAQWNNEGRYVTALLLRNVGHEEVRLDPRMFRGSRYWETASLISDTLSPSDHYGDSTALVVISDKRWEDYEQWLR